MEHNLNLTKYLESGAYLVQKAIISRETNSLDAKRGFAPIRHAELSRIYQTDFSVFKKTKEEKILLKKLKSEYQKNMRNNFPGIRNKEMSKIFTVHSKMIS